MANIPENLRYTKDHEWVAVNGNEATVGITHYAQNALGDVVYIELPNVGESLDAHDVLGSVESVKAVSEIFIPISGEILEINETLNDTPEVVNDDPYGDAWLIKVKMDDTGQIDELLSAVEYGDFLESEDH